MARKISMIDLAGIGNLLEYLVAADNITCEERDRIILRIAKENDIAEYTLSALAGYGKSKSEVSDSRGIRYCSQYGFILPFQS